MRQALRLPRVVSRVVRMAVIHIEPLPPRCGPGVILKFVAERGKLDGKQVGKIAKGILALIPCQQLLQRQAAGQQGVDVDEILPGTPLA